jgi:putative glutamine amidotransferase
MTRRLRIGVSARIQYGDAAKRGYLKKDIYYLEQSFARWLQSAGVLVYLVADVVDRAVKGPAGALTLADYAAELDGLVLQGGTDISPQTYGEEPLRPEWAGDPERDRYELELFKSFLNLKKPILGVCRGQQIINVALGGTLFQDTATQKPGAQLHQDPAIYDENYHHIEILGESRLAGLYPGITRAKVNTLHHQAVNRLGKGLAVEAHSAEDGVIEAIRYEGPEYLVGVQWHPEFLHGRDDGVLDSAPLLDEFLQASRENSQSR